MYQFRASEEKEEEEEGIGCLYITCTSPLFATVRNFCSFLFPRGVHPV